MNMRFMPYALPAATAIILILFFASGMEDFTGIGSGLTGMAALHESDSAEGQGASREIEARIMVSAYRDNVIPTDSIINIVIEGTVSGSGGIKRSASMPMKEFVQASGKPYRGTEGDIHSIDYAGPSLAGGNYTVDLSAFNIDRALPPGQYMLTTEVARNGSIIISSRRLFEIQ